MDRISSSVRYNFPDITSELYVPPRVYKLSVRCNGGHQFNGKPSNMRVSTHKSLIGIFDRIQTEKRVVRCSAQYEFPKLRIRKKKIVLVSMEWCSLCIRSSNTTHT